MSGWRREGCRITASPDLNTLFPASANLFATITNKINKRGQISGMAIARSGPDTGNLHAFLATPTHQSMGKSFADVAPTRPQSNLPANVGEQFLRRFGLAIPPITGFVSRVCARAMLEFFAREDTFALPVMDVPAGFLWKNGVMYDLNKLIPPGQNVKTHGSTPPRLKRHTR